MDESKEYRYEQMEKIVSKVDEIEELRFLQELCIDKITFVSKKMRRKLKVGDTVTVQNLGKGVIQKVNRTRARIKLVRGNYDVPFSMISDVEKSTSSVRELL